MRLVSCRRAANIGGVERIRCRVVSQPTRPVHLFLANSSGFQAKIPMNFGMEIPGYPYPVPGYPGTRYVARKYLVQP